MLVSNGFFLLRFPELPQVLVDAECQLEISQHGTHQDYLERFREVKAIVWSWRKQYPKLRTNIRKSHKGWMRQYDVIDGEPTPFNSEPDSTYRVCMQRTCTQLVNGCLAKCPALAYWPQLEENASLELISEWDLFRSYEDCPPGRATTSFAHSSKPSRFPSARCILVGASRFVVPVPCKGVTCND